MPRNAQEGSAPGRRTGLQSQRACGEAEVPAGACERLRPAGGVCAGDPFQGRCAGARTSTRPSERLLLTTVTRTSVSFVDLPWDMISLRTERECCAPASCDGRSAHRQSKRRFACVAHSVRTVLLSMPLVPDSYHTSAVDTTLISKLSNQEHPRSSFWVSIFVKARKDDQRCVGSFRVRRLQTAASPSSAGELGAKLKYQKARASGAVPLAAYELETPAKHSSAQVRRGPVGWLDASFARGPAADDAAAPIGRSLPLQSAACHGRDVCLELRLPCWGLCMVRVHAPKRALTATVPIARRARARECFDC